MELPLSALPLGEHAYIGRVEGTAELARRLTELGLLPGTRIACELVSPAGDPVAYRVRGALIALRKRDAAGVTTVPGTERSS